MKLKGTKVNGTVKDGKFIKADTGARHPVVKARRQRNKGKVTGVKPAK